MKQFFWLDIGKITDGELADLISELKVELDQRKRRINTGNWLNDQLEANRLETRSWTPQDRINHGISR